MLYPNCTRNHAITYTNNNNDNDNDLMIAYPREWLPIYPIRIHTYILQLHTLTVNLPISSSLRPSNRLYWFNSSVELSTMLSPIALLVLSASLSEELPRDECSDAVVAVMQNCHFRISELHFKVVASDPRTSI